MTVPKWIDPKITIGNIVTLAVMVVGFFVWGVRLEARVDHFAEKISKMESVDAKMSSQIDAARDLATNRQEALINRLGAVEANTAAMRAILERLERRP